MKKITVIACLLALLTLSACGAQTLPADEGDVPPVEGISQTQEDGQTGTKVVYIPMWMQDYSVVYYDAHLNRTVESGGDLTEEEINSREDISTGLSRISTTGAATGSITLTRPPLPPCSPDALSAKARPAGAGLFVPPYCCASAAATKPRNRGWGRSGRLLNSGWNWQPTNHGWSAISTISTKRPSGDVPATRRPTASSSGRNTLLHSYR